MIVLLGTAAIALLMLFGAAIAWEATHPPRRTAAWAIANDRPIDPQDLGLAFGEWTLDRPDGATMPVWDVALARTVPSPRPTLVVLHGWGRSRIDSLGRLAALVDAAPQAFDRAILPELRGHGEASEGITRLADGEDADLLELLRRVDAPSYVVAGHSMGAVVAILAAASADPIAERVRAVIAWAPYPDVHVPIRNRLRARDVAARPFSDVAILLLRLSGVRRRRTLPSAAHLRCPLLVIEGDRDIVSPVDGAAAIAEAAPNGTLVILPGAHPDVHEVSRDGHAAAVREFLDVALRQ